MKTSTALMEPLQTICHHPVQELTTKLYQILRSMLEQHKNSDAQGREYPAIAV
jgi:hypothetical protein